MRKKINLIIVVIVLTFCSTNYAQDNECNYCISQYNSNESNLYWYKAIAIASQCTPIFGSENQAGLSDVFGYVAEDGYLGTGAIFTGLDLANDFWNCVNQVEQDYYRGLEALAYSLENCFRSIGCHYTGWGYWRQSQNNVK